MEANHAIDASPPWVPAKCNCLVWAFTYRLTGGKITVTRSSVPYLPRFMWSPDDETWFSYVPNLPRRRPWYRVVRHAIWFNGHIAETKPIRRDRPRSNRSGHVGAR